MKKETLNNNMVVETREGIRLLVHDEYLINTEEWMSLDIYSNDLIVNMYNPTGSEVGHHMDIMKVYSVVDIMALNDIFDGENLIKIWQRKPQTFETLDDISGLFEDYLERDKDKMEVWNSIYDALDTETKKFCNDVTLTTFEVLGLITKEQADSFFKELFPEEKGE